jgi:trk system potassium uptake protein TrkA
LERCDVVVAATGDDEDNLVVSLLAKQEFAVPRVIARVNHPQNEWLFNENWGVDLYVSTPHLITAMVEEAVTVGRLVRILQFGGGQVRLVEVTLADDSPAIDKSIRELDVPRDATIVAVVRDEHVVMPRGDTVFEARDEVLAMVTPDSEDEVRRMLTGG